MNLKTTITAYMYDLSKPSQAEAYKQLCAERKAQGVEPFIAIDAGHLPKWWRPTEPVEIELETKHLFQNQWNTAPIEGISESGIRAFDWAQCSHTGQYCSRNLRVGYYLEQTDEMKAIRNNTLKCGYCSHSENIEVGNKFCPACLDSEYLEAEEIYLTRLMPVSFTGSRESLTEEERAERLPLYKKAQLEGSTERGKARLAKQKKDIEDDYEKTIRNATVERDGKRWVVKHVPGLLGNLIYYNHTRRFSFGWRQPISGEILEDLKRALAEHDFPYPCDVDCAGGKKFSREPGTGKAK